MSDEMSGFNEFFLREGFSPVDESMFSVLKKHQGNTIFAEMSAALIIGWEFVYNGLYKIINGVLCIVYFREGQPVYFTFHRPANMSKEDMRNIIDVLYNLARNAGLPLLQIRCIEERFLEELETLDGYTVQNEYQENDSEYVFRTEDFLGLGGRANKDKRWRYNKCVSRADISFQPMTKENVGLCLEVQDEWCHGRDCAECASYIGCERKALERMVAIFDEHTYQGLFLYLGGVLVGYGIGELLTPEVAVVYYGKSPANDYLFYITYVMVKTFFANIEYINLDSDVGNEGIRTFKKHLGVHELRRKYICTFKRKGDRNE
jgi:hypothetical protein